MYGLHMQGRAADIRCSPEYMDELWQILQADKDDYSELISNLITTFSSLYETKIKANRSSFHWLFN